MICHECCTEDKVLPGDDLTTAQIVAMCRSYRCARCSRTPEQVQVDFDSAAKLEKHEPAHDWSRCHKPLNAEITGGRRPSGALPG
jgi:hypothetical protein